MTTFTLSERPAHDEETEVLVVFAVAEGTGTKLLGGLPDSITDSVTAGLELLRAKGKADEVSWLPGVAGVTASLVAVVGVGGPKDGEPTTEQLRRAAGTAGRVLAGRAHAAVVLPARDAETVGAIAEGVGYGSYRFPGHRGAASRAAADDRGPVEAVRLATGVGGAAQEDAEDAVRRAAALVEGVRFARDLVNTSPNELFPESFAARVRDTAPAGLEVTVLDEQALAEAGCGGILGVGQGSENPPSIARLTYAPAGATTRLAFVGKGITFDSGGLCLKTPTGMLTMKCDMGGAAAVAGAIATIARLGLPVAVEGWLCLAENMPDGRAQRPGDVVTMADGTTCEIINTDAEGRLVLADGLVLASQEKPDAIIDIATLTGAAIVALGHRTAAVLANDDEFQGEVTSAATDCGESVWPMPIPEEIGKGLESNVADRKHAGAREGGTLLAAAFLREYVGPGEAGTPIPWAHLDIAGPAFHEGAPYGYTPEGGTGFGVRTLVGLAESRS